MSLKTPQTLANNAPNGANVLLQHRDGRMFYAEAFTIGSTFWDDTGSNPRSLQGMIYNLRIVAKRSGEKSNIWTWVDTNDVVVVPITKSKPATQVSQAPVTPRQERMAKAASALTTARSKAPVSKPAASPTPVVKEKVVVQPAVTEAPKNVGKVAASVEPEVKPITQGAVKLNMSDFMSIKDLNDASRPPRPEQMFISLRSNGKIILSRALAHQLPWKTMNFMITQDFKYLAICQGDQYKMNKTGTYFHKGLVSKVSFPKGIETVRIFVEWDDNLKALVGSFPS